MKNKALFRKEIIVIETLASYYFFIFIYFLAWRDLCLRMLYKKHENEKSSFLRNTKIFLFTYQYNFFTCSMSS